MCGIIGAAGNNLSQFHNNRVRTMLASLSRRGPDDTGELRFQNCFLGQTRLSIIDLAGGHQPMRDNEKNIAVTFNGEIYNYQELKRSLEQQGHRFSTKSDTEVILKAYRQYGADCAKHLDGMFSFALWDDDQRILLLARDRFGKKPLYYAYDHAGNLIVASEIKALTASGLIQGILDHEALDNYLALMYIPPLKTIYSNVYTLPPAHTAVYQHGKLVVNQYWRLEHHPVSISMDNATQRVDELLKKAVRKRLIAADVEVGLLLSGGVDSTLITAIAQSYSSVPLKTFSVGYGSYINELPFAEQASKTFGTDHYILQAGGELTNDLCKAIAYFDEPHADSSDFPQGLVSALAHTKVKVALSGDGADELFFGYGWYWKHWNLPRHQRLIKTVFSNPFAEFLNAIQVISPAERRKLWGKKANVSDSFVPSELRTSSLDPVSKINIFDLTTYLPGQLLTKVDRMGMMNSLEVRCPFLDHHLAEFVFSLPVAYKTDRHNGKLILKRILEKYMPRDFVWRRKQGFGAPVQQWLNNGGCKELLMDTLDSPAAKLYDILDKKVVLHMRDAFYRGDARASAYKVWILLCLELWLKAHASDYTLIDK